MINEKKMIELINEMDLDIKIKTEDLKKPFDELGMDSLDVFNLISEVEIYKKIKISDSDFEKIKSINDLIILIKML